MGMHTTGWEGELLYKQEVEFIAHFLSIYLFWCCWPLADNVLHISNLIIPQKFSISIDEPNRIPTYIYTHINTHTQNCKGKKLKRLIKGEVLVGVKEQLPPLSPQLHLCVEEEDLISKCYQLVISFFILLCDNWRNHLFVILVMWLI